MSPQRLTDRKAVVQGLPSSGDADVTHAKRLSSVPIPLCSKSAMDVDKGLEASASTVRRQGFERPNQGSNQLRLHLLSPSAEQQLHFPSIFHPMYCSLLLLFHLCRLIVP